MIVNPVVQSNRKELLLVLISLLLSAAVCGPVWSQEREETMLEEITVTAQKRAEGLQDVPISVHAVSGERIRNSNIGKLEDLSAYVPTLQINEATGTDSLYIRGLGSGINMGFEQSVGLVVDGVYYGRSRYSRGQFLDVERVEVLKGPQGILFGKNTTSGVVNITTASPSQQFEGWISAGYEFENEETTVEGAVSVPFSENFAARLAVRYNELDKGWVHNGTTGKDQPTSDDQVYRLSLLWTPGDDVRVSAKWQHSDFEQTGRNTVLVKCSPLVTDALAALPSEEDCEWNTTRYNTSPGETNDPEAYEQQDSDYDLFSLTVDWNIGDYTLTSVSGYSEYFYDDLFTTDHFPVSAGDANIAEDYEQFSQEFRLASPTGKVFEYTVGAFYQDTSLDVLWNLYLDVPNFLGFGPAFSRNSHHVQDSDMLAVFAQGTWNVSDSVSVTAGARWSDEDKAATSFMAIYPQKYAPNPTVPPSAVLHDVAADRSESNIAPMVNVVWHVTDDVMTYATVSKGFKGGGFDLLSPFPQADAAFKFEYDKEEALAFEIGSKMSLLDGRGEINIALFRTEFDDLQVSALSPVGNLDFYVTNAAKAISQGLEFDSRWQLTERFFMALNAAFMDVTYDEFPNAACYALQTEAEGCIGGVQDQSGADLPFAPDFSANLLAEYTVPVNDFLQTTFSINLNYSDDYYIASDNDPFQIQDSYTKVDARISLGSIDGYWELALVGKNLTDEKTTVWGNDVSGAVYSGSYYWHLDRMRTIALQANYRF